MNEDVVMIELSAIGNNSNATATHTCWVTSDFVEQFKDQILNFNAQFDDIDGKHSKTDATVNILTDHDSMALAYADSLGESWQITESMFDSFEELTNDDINELINFNNDINDMVSITTKTIVRIGDVEVVV
jgi:hypothetical protein